MRRRLLALWLISAIVSYGIGIAFDGHWLERIDSSHPSHQMSSQMAQDAEAETCDHCCHASAHVIGLSHTLAPSERALIAPILPQYTFALVSFASGPRPKPPKSLMLVA